MLSPLFIIWKLTRMLRWLPFGIALGGKRGGGWFPMFFKVSELLRDGGGCLVLSKTGKSSSTRWTSSFSKIPRQIVSL